jgi:hypothetical protein
MALPPCPDRPGCHGVSGLIKRSHFSMRSPALGVTTHADSRDIHNALCHKRLQGAGPAVSGPTPASHAGKFSGEVLTWPVWGVIIRIADKQPAWNYQ